MYRNEDMELDTTPGRKMCRKFLKKDPDKFLSRLQAMETAHAARKVPLHDPGWRQKQKDMENADGPDEGTERVVEVIDRLLKEWDDGRKV